MQLRFPCWSPLLFGLAGLVREPRHNRYWHDTDANWPIHTLAEYFMDGTLVWRRCMPIHVFWNILPTILPKPILAAVMRAGEDRDGHSVTCSQPPLC